MSDISELFARDPLSLSQQDLDQIIAKLRESRHQFNTTGRAPAKAPKVSAEGKAAADQLSLKDLGL